MVKKREYLCSVGQFNTPAVVEGRSAIGLLLIRLILLTPGSDPLHPTMGLGIADYRYGWENSEELRSALEKQIETFLPEYSDATVLIITNPDKTMNIEISIDDVVYVYDSSTAPVPITLSDIQSN